MATYPNAVPVNIVDAAGNIVTSFAGPTIGNAGGSVTVNSDGSITIVGLGSGTTLTGGITVDSLTISTAISQIIAGATSLALRNHANNANNLLLTDVGLLTLRGQIASYLGLALAGTGVPIIVANGRAVAQSAAVSNVCSFTPAADGTFFIDCMLLVTTAGTATAFNCQCTFTDEGGTARTSVFSFVPVAGTPIVTSIGFALGTIPYIGLSKMIRVKGGTTITILTQAAGTYTGVTPVVFNIDGLIRQVA